MNGKILLVLLFAGLCFIGLTLIAQSRTSGRSSPTRCAVTIPNGSELPGQLSHHGPSDHSARESGFYGNGKLWTTRWLGGTVEFRPGGPGSIESGGSPGMKFPWWRGVRGKLAIEGRRLDVSAPPLRAIIPEDYGDTGFQSTGLIFPTEGCWEVTGRVGETSLTFVTRVVKVGDGR